jgi:hypothetical protein
MANRKIDDEQAQQGAGEEAAIQEKKPQASQASPYTTKDSAGNEVPWYPAPAGHASQHMTAIGARGQDMFAKGSRGEDPGLPDAVKPVSALDQKFVPVPAGGIMQLAEDLYPGDVKDAQAMQQHVFDLFLMNRDRIRTDTDYNPGLLVRVA